MFLFEVLSSPVPWKWVEKSDDLYRATFDVNDHPYEVSLTYDERDNDWIVEFVAIRHVKKGWFRRTQDEKTFGLTGTGSSHAVLATVKDVVQKFRQIVPSAGVKFAAHEPSRQRLYTSLVKRFAPATEIKQNPAGPTEYRLR